MPVNQLPSFVTQESLEAWSDRLKLAKGEPDSQQEVFTEAMAEFKAHFTEQVNRAQQEVEQIKEKALSEPQKRELDSAAEAAFDSIAGYSLTEKKRASPKDLRKILQAADVRAKLVVEEVRQRAAWQLRSQEAEITPQLVKGGSQNGFSLIRKAPELENLVLSGGGAKGAGLPSTLIEMHKAGMLEQLKQVAGSSAGAIVATMLAAGVSPEKLESLLAEFPPEEMIKTEKDFSQQYPMYKGVKRTGAKTGGNILKLVDQEVSKSVIGYLKENFESLTELRAQLNAHDYPFRSQDIDRLEFLMSQDLNPSYPLEASFAVDRSGKMITFRDLKLMSELAPDRFKSLTVTACDRSSHETFLFNEKEQPNLEVALAARISAGLPPVFQSVSLNLGSAYGVRTLMDGGLGSNIPDEAILGNIPVGENVDEHLRARTAVIAFAGNEDGKYTNEVLHGLKPRPKGGTGPAALLSSEGRGRLISKVVSAIFSPVFKLFVPTETRQSIAKDRASLHNAGPNGFVAFHGDLKTRSFSASEARLFDAKASARVKTLEQINLRVNQASYVHVNTVEQACNLLSQEEKDQVLRAGDPGADNMPGSELYQEVLRRQNQVGVD